MTPDEYCISVCGAKCCYLRSDTEVVKCPRLIGSRCSIYQQRFRDECEAKEVVGLVRIGGDWQPFVCGQIADLLLEGALPDWVAAQCCYAHPELLEDVRCSESQK